jgi:D-alanyl-D-alanine carboxypeptidase
MIVSAYRTQEEQDFLFQRKLNGLLASGWNPEKARTEAAKSVAIPGTSEHQLGLAVDIIDSNYGYLDDYQAQMPTQKWLMEHCHEYGFILRYPVGTTEITGIIFEPWHYRYVGVEIAQEIMNLGITLEEYLGAV